MYVIMCVMYLIYENVMKGFGCWILIGSGNYDQEKTQKKG